MLSFVSYPPVQLEHLGVFQTLDRQILRGSDTMPESMLLSCYNDLRVSLCYPHLIILPNVAICLLEQFFFRMQFIFKQRFAKRLLDFPLTGQCVLPTGEAH